ncbi:ATP-binding protein [Sinorhizobium medicae]|uniref:ATP-binding protein n=1 Tax=Sinorhizobium medicae TaxID=110321 RepID=UPI002D768B2C|nr:ATP-binding protein [Sinorhizobium medicae]
MTGQTGTGKTWIACAFARQAARLDYSVLYVRMPRLFEDRAGSVCLNSFGRFAKWISASIMLPPSSVSAR